jgi:Tol biopolymer transport system component
VSRRRIGRVSLLVVVALAIAAGFTTAVASAATVYIPTGGKFAADQEWSFGQIGVDAASGRILVPSPGSGKVEVYAPSEKSATLEGSFGEGQMGVPYSLAVDQDARAVYVGDGSVNKIFKYTISGTGPLTFTHDPSFTSPAIGPEPEQIAEGGARLAVDPTTGDLLVADRWNYRVSRFDSSGKFLDSYTGDETPAGSFVNLSSVAVDNDGDIYVVDITEGDIQFGGSKSVLLRFSPDGTLDNSFAPALETPRTVAVDHETNTVLVSGRSNGAYDPKGIFPIRLYTIEGDQIIDEYDFPAGYESVITTGLAAGAKRLYVAANAFEPLDITVFDAFDVPVVTLDEPTAVTTTTAQVSGTVDPLGKTTRYHFEYSREGGVVQSTEEIDLAAAMGPQPVSAELTGLIPNSEYAIRLVAGYPATGGAIRSQPRTLKTVAAPPAVTTGRAVDVGTTATTLLGKVNPHGEQTTYYFEYGATAAYGQRSPTTHGDVAGNGREPLPVHAYLKGLQPGTTYHYRLVAENATGVSEGFDRTFTTDGVADAPRFFEQVSPVEKGGSEVNGLRGFWASADGETLNYTYKTAPSEGEAGVVNPRSSAWRGPDGWDSTPLDAPQLPGTVTFAGPLLTFVGGISDDGTKAVTVSTKNLAPGAVEGQSNLYVRDTRTGALETMVTSPGISLLGDVAGLGRQPFFDGTPDYSHILIKPTEATLIEGAPFGALYEWTDDEGVRIASVDENGNPLGPIVGGGGPSIARDINYLSDDGSKLFFTHAPIEGAPATYVRINGQKSLKIGGYFAGATSDGRWAFVAGANLTPESPVDVMSLYRFDTEAGEDGELELLTEAAGGTPSEAVIQITPDGSSIYFSGERALVPDAEHGNMNLYVWHAGEVQLIASIPKEGNRPQEYMASPNGRWFAFTSWSNLTEYDSRSKTACVEFSRGDPQDPVTKGGVACKQVYRYDVETEELLCASCPPDGAPPIGGARMGPENVEGDFNFPRAMLDDGTVIFDTPQPLSGADSNSNRDVYTFDGSDTTLISGGRTASRSEFDEASADGSSIFFTTQDQLVGQDKDTIADVYVSRVNGGIAAQNPPPPRGECIRDDCKETPNAGPEMPFGGSEALSGPGNVKPKKAGKRCGKGRQVRKVKGKSRCVKKQPGKAKKQKRANSNRRQGR